MELYGIEVVVGDDIDIHTLVETNPEKASILLDYKLKTYVASERESWINRAHMVYYMKETEVWKHHPENFSSFYEYCMQPAIDIAPSVVSDMLAVVKFAPHLEAVGINIWDVIQVAGHSKVRQIIPQIRDAWRAGALKEQIQPLIASIEGMSFREVLEMTSTNGIRTRFELEAIYQETPSGQINVIFEDLDIDDLEYLTKKAGIKRWFDPNGRRIDPPMNDPELKALKE